jgi:hypothetical protein
MKKTRSGFTNAAADKIWNDHIGNNAFVRHRDQCAICLDVIKRDVPGQRGCDDGERIFEEMLDEIYAKIEETFVNQN